MWNVSFSTRGGNSNHTTMKHQHFCFILFSVAIWQAVLLWVLLTLVWKLCWLHSNMVIVCFSLHRKYMGFISHAHLCDCLVSVDKAEWTLKWLVLYHSQFTLTRVNKGIVIFMLFFLFAFAWMRKPFVCLDLTARELFSNFFWCLIFFSS